MRGKEPPVQRSEVRPFHVEDMDTCGSPDVERACLRNRDKASGKESGRWEDWEGGKQESSPQHGLGKRLGFMLRTMGALGGFRVSWLADNAGTGSELDIRETGHPGCLA